MRRYTWYEVVLMCAASAWLATIIVGAVKGGGCPPVK